MEYLAVILYILCVFFFLLGMYFLPGMLAFHREHPRAWAILGLNFVLGWSVMGWLAAMFWALSDDGRAEAGGEVK